MPTLHNRLLAPVVLVTKGRGREVFDDSRALMGRLQEIPMMRDSVMSIQQEKKGAVTEDGIAALEVFLAVEGWSYFNRAAQRRHDTTGEPVQRFGTRWNWRFFGEYLGWEWREM